MLNREVSTWAYIQICIKKASTERVYFVMFFFRQKVAKENRFMHCYFVVVTRQVPLHKCGIIFGTFSVM